MCSDPTYVASAGGERLGSPPLEVGTPAHRILELGAVRLHTERHAGREPDGAAEQHVIGEDQVGREQGAQRCSVGFDVGRALAG